jgi:Transposase, Mutator family
MLRTALLFVRRAVRLVYAELPEAAAVCSPKQAPCELGDRVLGGARIVEHRRVQRAPPPHRTTPATVLAVGDGALGFWKALQEMFPDAREQRCWFHVSSNVLAALSKSAHPRAKAALAEICHAEDMAHVLVAVKAFAADCGAKWPKAVAKITEHVDVLLAF